jgi:F-type H+-transporting ATPase subunit gamma
MKTYLAYKNEIQGFRDVAETVKSMEKIAASSIHFLKQRVANFDEYANAVRAVLARLSDFYAPTGNILLEKRPAGRKALVVLTGDKGLVDGLWHETVNTYMERKTAYTDVIIIGEKGRSYVSEEHVQIRKFFPNPSGQIIESDVETITDYLFREFKNGTYAAIDILYPRFISLAEQQPAYIPFLPFEFKKEALEQNERPDGLPIFEPAQKEVFDWFFEKYIEIFFHRIMTETKLSEFSARTVAMEEADEKTRGLIRQLTVSFHKERKRDITQKQIQSFSVKKLHVYEKN